MLNTGILLIKPFGTNLHSTYVSTGSGVGNIPYEWHFSSKYVGDFSKLMHVLCMSNLSYGGKYFLSAIAEPNPPVFCRNERKPGPLHHWSNIPTSSLIYVCRVTTHHWKALTSKNSKHVFVFENDVICVRY